MNRSTCLLCLLAFGCATVNGPKKPRPLDAPFSVKDDACPLRVKNLTLAEYPRSPDDTYRLAIRVRDTSWLKGGIECFAIVHGIEHPMQRNGDRFSCRHTSFRNREILVQFKIVYTGYTLAPTKQQTIYLFPFEAPFRVSIQAPEKEVFLTKKSVRIACHDQGRDTCPSEVVSLKNHGTMPIRVLSARVIAHQPTSYSIHSDWSGKKFYCVFNGVSPPFILDQEAEMTFVVHSQHSPQPSYGELVITTDHPQCGSLHLPLFAQCVGTVSNKY